MSFDTTLVNELGGYGCPAFKRPLRQEDALLFDCSKTYTISAGIPDFILEDGAGDSPLEVLLTVNAAS